MCERMQMFAARHISRPHVFFNTMLSAGASASVFRSLPPTRIAIRWLATDTTKLWTTRWQALNERERSALQLLGWKSERDWNKLVSDSQTSHFPPPYTSLTSEQQAAVKYGLEWSESQYELARSAFYHEHPEALTPVSSPSSVTASSTVSSSFSSASSSSKAITTVGSSAPSTTSTFATVGKMLLKTARAAAPVVAPLLRNAKHPAAKIASAALEFLPVLAEMGEPRVRLADVSKTETVIYLDDSGSMKGGGLLTSPLSAGRDALSAIAERIKGSPTRIVKFGTFKSILSPRDETGDISPELVNLAWTGTSGGTYMWHMIEQDVIERFAPPKKTASGAGDGKGAKLRIVVITDGEDSDSPAGYNGVAGMNPMMKTLTEEGYDIEWHIILLNSSNAALGEGVRRKYEALTRATGGGFLTIDVGGGGFFSGTGAGKGFDRSAPDVKQFLNVLERDDEQERRRRQRGYALEAKSGKAEKFDWFQLPPSSKS